MENTIENKAKFFAQYWGQLVGCTKWQSDFKICKSNFGNIEWLEITPLQDITDEHEIEVAKIYLREYLDFIEEAKTEAEYLEYGKETINSRIHDTICADYLRRKSYILPYLDLSVEQALEYGWARLTTGRKL